MTIQRTTNQRIRLGAGRCGDLHAASVESDHLQSQLALLTDIENGLRSMQSALRSRNIEGLRQATSRIARCHAELKMVLRFAGSGPARNSTSGARMREAQWRVLQLGRVQAALLARAQRSLTAVTNALTGGEASYRPPIPMPLPDRRAGDHRCRV
jgi:hypothetical protein